MPGRNQFLSGLVPPTSMPEEADTECPICYEAFAKPMVMPECQHVFCKGCISTWVNQRGKNHCPMCRRKLFVLNDAERGSVGADAFDELGQALTHSGLLTDSFNTFSHDINFTTSTVRRAASDAFSYLAAEHEPPRTYSALLDPVVLGPHLIAMGNLLHGWARAMGRPYSAHQIRDWDMIVDRVYALLDGSTRRRNRAVGMADELRTQLVLSLRADGVDVDSGQFFARTLSLDSPSVDLDILIDYCIHQWEMAYGDRECREATRGVAQRLALRGEVNPVRRALRWTRQRLFGMI